MTLLSKASLVATPTAYGDGVLNSVKPTDGAGDFDFARASSATRVNEQGLIEKERENLLLQSNQFDTTWTNYLSSDTSGQVGYDGSNDAWLLTTTGAGGRLDQVNISSTNVQSISVYAKANTYDYLYLIGLGAIDRTGFFDLTNGVVGTTQNLIDSSIQSIGNGWHRCTIIFNDTISQVRIAGAQGDNDLTGTSGSIYIQDAQLEAGLVATDYIETTTSSVAVGITNNIPRINYENGIGNFLLEPQRTNYVTNSEYFGAWINVRTTDTSNADISPEGLQNATSVKPDSTPSTNHEFYGTTSGTYNNWSGFFKADGYGWIYMFLSGQPAVWFDIENGLVGQESGGATGQIENYGNGWYRCIYNAPSSSSIIGFGVVESDGSLNITSPDTSQGVLFYGAQQETGYHTTYIPTFGSSVTRAAETCNNAGNSDLFNDSEGVLYAEVSFADRLSAKAISISGGSFTNRVLFYLSTSGNLSAYTFVGGVNQCNITVGFNNYSDISKLALKYKENDFALWINGVEVGTDTSGTTFSAGALTELSFDANGAGADVFYGKTKMVSTFTEALSDSELECLTSWSSFNRMATAQNYNIE